MDEIKVCAEQLIASMDARDDKAILMVQEGFDDSVVIVLILDCVDWPILRIETHHIVPFSC